MASARDIRRRIKSVKNTAQITKAMQMVAASKMRRAQERALEGRPYAEKLNQLIDSLGHRAENLAHPLWEEREGGKPCVLLISTDKGLCGGLNTNLLREISKLPEETAFVTIGRKGQQFVARTKRNLVADFPISEKAGFMESKQVSQFLVDKFIEGEFSSIQVYYTNFINTLVQKPEEAALLPIKNLEKLDVNLEDEKKSVDSGSKAGDDLEFTYEPSADAVLSELFPTYIHFKVYHLLLESLASEHSARMVAMKSATENANDLVKDLTLDYNKARQAAITGEILEIASAQMAMQQ